ncbi:MAG: hypothetical protein ACT4PG_02785 [Panacagrimonas sp.]
MSLRVLVPKAVTDAMLTSSSVDEPVLSGPYADPPVWDVGTTYALADLVHRPNHRVYRSRISSNTGKVPEDSPIEWVDLRPTNRWAMFDGLVKTATRASGTLNVVLKPGFHDSLYFGGLDAATITITQRATPGGTVVYTRTVILRQRTCPGWYAWLFGTFATQRDLLITGLIPRSQSETTLEITGTEIAVGLCVVGSLRTLGQTEFGGRSAPQDYSYVRTDEYGETTIKRGEGATDITLTAKLNRAEADSVYQLVSDLRGTPCVWIGSNQPGRAGLRTFGLGKCELIYDNVGKVSLEVFIKGSI